MVFNLCFKFKNNVYAIVVYNGFDGWNNDKPADNM